MQQIVARSESLHVPEVQSPWHLYSRTNRRAFLIVLFLVGTSNYVDRNIIGVLLEQIKAEFAVSDTMLGLLSGTSFALLYATLGIPIARWADRGDRTFVITLSLAVWSVMTVLCGFASTFGLLLLARFGVGAGEAGAIPASQSLIADYYPPSERARAIGIFMMSSAAGYALGLILGGYLAEHHGWRVSLVAVGTSGLVLAPVTYFLLKEPRRAQHCAISTLAHESVRKSLRALFAKPAYRNILASMVVYFFIAYGALVFIVSLMIRAHGLSVAEAGAVFGIISTIAAVIGSFFGGAFADRLAARDLTWLAKFPGWGLIVAAPLFEFAVVGSNFHVMCALLLVATTLLTAALPSAYSAMHVVCGSTRRALSVAVAFFFANLMGLGLGPLAAGWLSDRFAVTYGEAEGLRYALMVVMPALVVAGGLLLRAARHVLNDAEA